jgi:hypothetical protein
MKCYCGLRRQSGNNVKSKNNEMISDLSLSREVRLNCYYAYYFQFSLFSEIFTFTIYIFSETVISKSVSGIVNLKKDYLGASYSHLGF